MYYPGQLYPGGGLLYVARTIAGASVGSSGAAWDSPTIASTSAITDTGGIPSQAAWDAPVVTMDEAIVDTGGIPSQAAWGTPGVTMDETIADTGGIPSQAAWGAPEIDSELDVSNATVGQSFPAWGTPSVAMDETIADTGGIPSQADWPVPVLPPPPTGFAMTYSQYPGGFYPGTIGWATTSAIIPPSGIPSQAAWGVPTLVFEQDITDTGGIPSQAAWGVPVFAPQDVKTLLGMQYPGGFYPGQTPTVRSVGTISDASIPSQAAWGVPVVASDQTIAMITGIPSQAAWGVPGGAATAKALVILPYPGGFYPGAYAAEVDVSPITDAGGIPSQAAWGTPAVLFASVIGDAGGFESFPAWGVPSVLLGILASYDPSNRRRPVGMGCGDYEVAILARGGGSRLVELSPSQIQWGRTIDAVSEATITLSAISSKCRRELIAIDAWSHELAIYRSGQRCWSGPLVKLNLGADESTLYANDLMAWFGVWWVWSDHNYPPNTDGTGATDLATIFNAIAADAASMDNTPGVMVTATPCGVLGSYIAAAAEHRIAADDLDSLTQTGIDWTTVDRQVIAGGAAIPTTPFAYFTDEDFAAPPTIVKDGTLSGNLWGVRGAGSGAGADVVWGEYGPSDPAYAALRAQYGLVARQATDDNLTDSTAAQASAQTRWAANHAPPAMITDAVLAPSAAARINDLVMGRIADIRLAETLTPIHTRYRMGTLQATVTPDAEELALTFQPIGTT